MLVLCTYSYILKLLSLKFLVLGVQHCCKGPSKTDVINDKHGDSRGWKVSESNDPNRTNVTILEPFLKGGAVDQI